MTTEMLSPAQMQKTPAAELRAIALHTTNRQYSIACTQMVAAMEAHGIGDSAAVKAHVDRCVVAHKRAQEDEHGQILRVRATAAAIAADGVQTGNVEVSGLATHYTSAETHRSTGAARRLVGVRS